MSAPGASAPRRGACGCFHERLINPDERGGREPGAWDMSSVAIEPLASREAATGAVGPLVFLAVVAWTALVHLPFYGLDGPDDAFYVEAAHLWTKRAPPYVGAFDVKAPGFFAVLAAAQLVFGASLATLRGVPILFEIYGDAAYAVLCAFTALAFLAALSDLPPMKKAVLAGLAIGAACSVKQTAALEALVLMAILAREA